MTTTAREFLEFLKRNLVVLVLACVSLVYVSAATVLHEKPISPIDEWLYIDYSYKVPTQLIVHQGETVGPETIKLMACDGFVVHGKFGKPCDEWEATSLKSLPNSGITTAASYTPIYFSIVRILGDPIHSLTGIDLVTSWRMTGAFWLAGGMVFLVLLFRRWKIPDQVSLAVGILFIASPFTLWTYSYLSTDAPSFFVGVVLLLLATRFARDEISGWWLLIGGVLASLLKITNVLGMGFIFLYLVLQWWHGWRGSKPSLRGQPKFATLLARAAILISGLLAVAISQVIWIKVVASLAVSSAVVDQGISRDLTLRDLGNQVFSFLPSAIRHNPLPSGAVELLYLPLSWILIAGVVGAFLSIRWGDQRAPMVWAVAVSAVIAAPLLALMMKGVTGSYFELPARYGAVLLPAFLLATGLIIQNRFATWLLVIYGTALLVAGLFFAHHISAVSG
jgi:hypothetical protein